MGSEQATAEPVPDLAGQAGTDADQATHFALARNASRAEVAQAFAEHQRILNRDLEQRIRQRRDFGRNAFLLVLAWLVIVLAIVIFSGWTQTLFHLSDKVLIALLTTTTANIVGLMVIVLKGVFDAPPAKQEEPKPTREVEPHHHD